MAQSFQARGRRVAEPRPHPGRTALRHARPRRLLAMRLRHPQRGFRGAARQGGRKFPRGDRCAQPGARGPRERDRLMGRREAAHRARRSPETLVSVRAPVHRRRGTCHVAGRRRRHQSRRSGRGRRRKHPVGAAASRGGSRGRTGQGAGAAAMADRDDAGGAALRAEADHQQCADHDRSAAPALGGATASIAMRCSAVCRRGSSVWASAPSMCARPRCPATD